MSICVMAENGDDAIRIYVDGNMVITEKTPVIENSRTLAPVRPVAEACGINVGWDGEFGKVTLTKDYTTVTLTVGSCEMQVYNSVIDHLSTLELEAAPVIIDSSAFMVLRPSLEAFGAGVEWDAENRVINISSVGKSDTDSVSTSDAYCEYTGFREMAYHTITESAPHGLYGRILSNDPITLVRCRIAGTNMDYSLFFTKESNITNYNVFTYFDKLICFSDAGIGKQTFEVYAAVNEGEAKLLFSYDYIVTAKNSAQAPGSLTADSDDTDNSLTGNDNETADETGTIGYYGFRKMTGDKIVTGAPHGLYGNVVSDYPITSVRCRLVDTEMDYRVIIPLEDEVYDYNVFTYFDQLICFSDAGEGNQTFEIYAGANNNPEQLIFSYTYTVVQKEYYSSTANSGVVAGNIPDESDVCLPLEGTIKVTSPYGFRAYNKWEFHKGVDIISESLNIIAVADGIVVDCATGRNSGVGNYVAIQHEGGWVSLYYHLASYDVEIGDTVVKGQRFATMGNTGGNYGVHLHFMTCDDWYGTLWSTQNNHHTPPHEYVPQLLTDVIFYNPSFEKVNTDKMILCTFRFPTVLEQGIPFSISSSKPFVASENPLRKLTLTITDEQGNTVLSESMENPEYTQSGLYTYTNITAAFDMICEFDKLPTGKMKVTVTAVSELGRERVVYEKDFHVVSAGESTEKEKAEAEAELSPEEAAKTDAFEAGEQAYDEFTEAAEATEVTWVA